MRFNLLILLLAFSSGCTSMYQIELAPRFDQSSRFSVNGINGNGEINYVETKGYGLGWSVGVIESSTLLFAKIDYSEVLLTDKKLVDKVNGNTNIDTNIRYSSLGVSLGFNLGYIKPYINSTSRFANGGVEEINFFGYGLRLEIPVSKNISVSFDYNLKKEYQEDGIYIGPRDELSSAYIGLVFSSWFFDKTNRASGR